MSSTGVRCSRGGVRDVRLKATGPSNEMNTSGDTSSSTSSTSSTGRELSVEEMEKQRMRTIDTIKSQGPYVKDLSVFDNKVSFSSPLQYFYGEPSEEVSELAESTTQNTIMFGSRVERGRFSRLMNQFEREAKKTKGETTVVRCLQVDPSCMVVRWKLVWEEDGLQADGSTTYRLGRSGLIISQEDTWTTAAKEDAQLEATVAEKPFPPIVWFGLSRRPLDTSPRASWLPALQMAAWEALRDTDYGSIYIRSEMDVLLNQALIALAALGVAVAALVFEIFYAIINDLVLNPPPV